MTIIGSEIIGNTGLALKGGHTMVIDSKVTGTGETQNTPAYSLSGFTDTGDGIYLETNYPWDVSVEIYGTSTVRGAAQAVRVFATDATNASVTIYGGTFSSDVAQFVADGSTYDAATFTVTT